MDTSNPTNQTSTSDKPTHSETTTQPAPSTLPTTANQTAETAHNLDSLIPNKPTDPVVITDTPPAKSRSPLVYIVPVLILGVFAGGLYFLRPKTPTEQPPVEQYIQALPTIMPFDLKVESPNASVTAVDGEILVSGKTQPGSTVIVYTDTDDTILETNTDGSFESSVLVGAAGGPVRITAISPEGEEISRTFDISASEGQPISMISEDVLGNSTTATGTGKKANTNAHGNQSDERDTPTTHATSTPKKTITPRAGTHEPASPAAKLKHFQDEKPEPPKNPKLGISKLKDLLSNESTRSGNASASGRLKHMVAKAATAGGTLKRHAVSGVISKVNAGSLSITQPTQNDRKMLVYFNTNTVVTGKEGSSSAAFAVGQRIAAVGEPTETGIMAKRIHIIPGKATGVFTHNPGATASGSLSPTRIPSVSPAGSATSSANMTKTPTPTSKKNPKAQNNPNQ